MRIIFRILVLFGLPLLRDVLKKYLRDVPISYDSIQSVPLMLNCHGWTMSATVQMSVNDMRALSDSEQFILVYPQGKKFWGSTHGNVGSNT